jgi:hypothetical protein
LDWTARISILFKTKLNKSVNNNSEACIGSHLLRIPEPFGRQVCSRFSAPARRLEELAFLTVVRLGDGHVERLIPGVHLGKSSVFKPENLAAGMAGMTPKTRMEQVRRDTRRSSEHPANSHNRTHFAIAES